MKYKLIASDLDGTLRGDGNDISPDNIKAIHRAIDSGVSFAICSGRSQHSVNVFNKAIGIDKPGCFGISFNGAVVYKADTMEVLYEHRLEMDIAHKVTDIIRESNPETPAMVYMQENLIYYETENKYNASFVEEYASFAGIIAEHVDCFNKSVNQGVLKIIIRWDPELLKKLADDIRDKVEPYCSMFYSSPNLLEFSPIDSNKAVGIKFLADYLGITMDETVAIGDNFNDIEMIKAAGLGIAVQNAVSDIKAAAGHITKADNEHSAVCEAIDFVLNKG